MKVSKHFPFSFFLWIMIYYLFGYRNIVHALCTTCKRCALLFYGRKITVGLKSINTLRYYLWSVQDNNAFFENEMTGSRTESLSSCGISPNNVWQLVYLFSAHPIPYQKSKARLSHYYCDSVYHSIAIHHISSHIYVVFYMINLRVEEMQSIPKHHNRIQKFLYNRDCIACEKHIPTHIALWFTCYSVMNTIDE